MPDLAEFLVRAKRATYASQGEGGERVRTEDAGRQLTFHEASWSYDDLYYGTNPFVGRELVHHDGELVWAMTYYGRVVDETLRPGDVYAFLKAAMVRVSRTRPFRGPASYTDGVWAYTDVGIGGLDMFSGTESIVLAGREVYRLHYSGGRMRGV
ncbi:MAG TPA: DUF5680 domain-containing protein [Dermatophilaceae bacterium]|nr:DUF5680 domain-containing protein [Dermatophilaceae bacterium]